MASQRATAACFILINTEHILKLAPVSLQPYQRNDGIFSYIPQRDHTMAKLLSLVSVALILVLCETKVSANIINDRFLEEEIVPDILDYLPDDMRPLRVVYLPGVEINLGTILSPSQTRLQPDVSWEAESAYYTLFMTGKLMSLFE